MNKTMSFDREINSISKILGYMVQAVQGTLSQETKGNLSRCQTDTDIFACLWSIPSAIDILSLEEEFERKSADSARNFRESGNAYFKKKLYLSALQEYNSCIIQAPFYCRDGQRMKECGLPINNEQLALAYGNRSAALFHLGKYEESLLDVQRALQLNYPQTSIHKLLHRQGSCQAKLNMFGMAKRSFEESVKKLNEQEMDERTRSCWKKIFEKCLAELPNKTIDETVAQSCNASNISLTIPALTTSDHNETKEVSSLIDFHKDSRNQNVVLSKDEINIGDVLIIEKPYASVLFPKRLKKTRCYNCFSSLPLNPVPCYDCTTVVFCNESCRDSSYQRFHRFECHYFALFAEDTCSDIGHLIIRIFMTLGVERVLNHLKKSRTLQDSMDDQVHNGKELEIGDEVVENCSSVEDEVDHQSVFKLEAGKIKKCSSLNNDEIMSLIELPFFACFLLKLLYISGFLNLPSDIVAKYMTPKGEASKLEVIQNNHAFETVVKTEDDLFLIGGFLVNCLRVGRRYGKLIREAKKFRDDPEKAHSSVIGIGLYPKAVSKINHSCDPSADIVHYDDVAIIRSIRNLKQGDEINISFGPLFHEMKLEPRRELLWKANSIMCNCVACYNKWPILEEMFDEVPGYRCEECRGILTASDKMEGKYLMCPVCNHKQNLEEIVEQLRVSFDDYAMAMNEAMSGNYEKALPGLSNHLQLIQRHVRQPWPDLVACQTAVKLSYRLMANREDL